MEDSREPVKRVMCPECGAFLTWNWKDDSVACESASCNFTRTHSAGLVRGGFS